MCHDDHDGWLLAQRTIAGDQRPFEILVQRYSTPLFNFIYHFLVTMTGHSLAQSIPALLYDIAKLSTSESSNLLFQVRVTVVWTNCSSQKTCHPVFAIGGGEG